MNLNDFDVPQTRIIPLKRIFIILSIIIVVLTVSCILVCGTNSDCKSNVPTLNNLLNTILVAPYVLTEINVIFWFHIFVSACLYYLTNTHAPWWSKQQFIASLLVYGSIVVTLFVLPFTSWDNDYANYLIIVFIMYWMLTVILSLHYAYEHLKGTKQWWIVWNVICHIVYVVSSIVYIVLRTFFSAELNGILIVEIFSGLAFLIFLSVCVIHIWHMQFMIQI